MYSYSLVIKPDETLQDLLQELQEETSHELDDIFIFSAVYEPKKKLLKFNSTDNNNTYSLSGPNMSKFLQDCISAPDESHYINAPLAKWIVQYRPMMCQLVEEAYPTYKKMYPEKDDLYGILGYTITYLYNKGFYLHKYIIKRSFINNLNKSIRKQKHFQDCKSLDAPICEEGAATLADIVPDSNDVITRFEDDEYNHFLFELIKGEMLKTMSQLSFDMILVQLESKTLTPASSKALSKMRAKFAPYNIPRPNARKNKEDE